MLNISRHFTSSGETIDDVFNGVEWKISDAIILDTNGNTVFEQKSVEYPIYFSDSAIKIISSKYLYGRLNTPEREYSLRQLITRVVNKIAEEGLKRKYFQDYQPPKKVSEYDSPYRCACGGPYFGMCLANGGSTLLSKESQETLRDGQAKYKTLVAESESTYNLYVHNYKKDPNSEYNIFKSELTYVLLHQMFSFNSPCFVAGANILLDDGTWKNIEDISIGDFVISHTQKPNKVTQIYKKDAKNIPGYSFNVFGLPNNQFTCTNNHAFLAVKYEELFCKGKEKHCNGFSDKKCPRCKKNNKKLNPQWTEAKDLRVNDYIVEAFDTTTIVDTDYILISDILENIDVKNDLAYRYFYKDHWKSNLHYKWGSGNTLPIKNKIEISNDLLRFLGYYLAEGDLDVKRSRTRFSFNKNEEKFINDVLNLGKDIFGISGVLEKRYKKNPNTQTIRFQSVLMAEFIKYLCGSHAKHKKIHKLIMDLPPQKQKDLLIGIFNGDGHVSSTRRLILRLANKNLVTQIFIILKRLDKFPTLEFRNDIYIGANNFVNEGYYNVYSVTINAGSILEVSSGITKYNLDQINEFIPCGIRVYDNLILRKIQNIEQILINEPVYNLEVENDHSYSVNGLSAHNCYFSVGTEQPNSPSACFCLGVEDNLESIFDHAKTEGLVFKSGAGIGVNLSKLRGSNEYLKGGGKSSGPCSFDVIFDSVAKVTKSGGRSRRAARLVCLDCDHPDLIEFIKGKSVEENKAKVLIEAGYDGDLNGEAYSTVAFQNENRSIRISDKFMEAVENDEIWSLINRTDGKVAGTHKARYLWDSIAKSCHETGDPGIQFDDTIQKWNTVSSSGKVTTSNPCLPGWATVLKLDQDGFKTTKIIDLSIGDMILSFQGWTKVINKFDNGIQDVYAYATKKGILYCTQDHKVAIRKSGISSFPILIKAKDAKELMYLPSQDLEQNLEIFYSGYHSTENVYDIEVDNSTHTFICNDFNVSNCSEFLGLDFTSCNLASINLLDNSKKEFIGYDNIKYITQLATIAMNILIDFGDYPTPKIAEETRKYRNIGIGFTNLGALLMLEGLPYDSDKGRHLAASIMALITAQAYKTSFDLAKIFGPYDRYKENHESHFTILCRHVAAFSQIIHPTDDKMASEIAIKAYDILRVVIANGKDGDDVRKYGLRNASVSLLAPCGCLTEDSLIQTQYGLIRLGSLGDKNGDQWQERNFNVMTDNGEKLATRFFINGQEETRTITTKKGYQITGTNKHKIKVLDPNNNLVWKKFDEISSNDTVAITMNTIFGQPRDIKLLPEPEVTKQNNFNFVAPRLMTKELAELIGYYMGDGCFCGSELRLAVDQKDVDVADRMQSLVKTLFNLESRICPQEGCVSVNVKSNALAIWWNDCGFTKIKQVGKGHIAYVPDAILETNNEAIYCSFLKGLFEADGSALTSTPTLASIHRSFINEIRSILLSIGFPTHTHVKNAENRPNRWSKKPLLTLRILNRVYSRNFIEKIGFISKRKNDAIKTNVANISGSNDRIPMSEMQYNSIKNKLSRSEMLTYYRSNSLTREQSIGLLSCDVDTEDGLFVKSENLLYDKVTSNEDGGIRNTYDISVPDGNTYIANGFISHNTINFMMDGVSSGVEPCLSLVTYKKLVGGGTIKAVNPIVEKALEEIGSYNDGEIASILKYIERDGTIENTFRYDSTPLLNPKHLPIFDCALKPSNGSRTISPEGHVKMLSSLQPHLSHSISKTVNLPNEATVEDIKNIYMMAWKLGVKCVAVYRDGCKMNQPMSTSDGKKDNRPGKPISLRHAIDQANKVRDDAEKAIKEDREREAKECDTVWGDGVPIPENMPKPSSTNFIQIGPCYDLNGNVIPEPMLTYTTYSPKETTLIEEINKLKEELKEKNMVKRKKLSDTRKSITHKVKLGDNSFYITVGLFEDGTVGEVFIVNSKHGSFASATIDTIATMISFGLQYGIPLEVIIRKLKGINFEPNGLTSNRDIPFAKSIIDYLAKYLERSFLAPKEKELPETYEPVESGNQPITVEKPKNLNLAYGVPPSSAPQNQPTLENPIQFSIPKTDIKVLNTNETRDIISNGQICGLCGELMIVMGRCFYCVSCGSSSGGCGG